MFLLDVGDIEMASEEWFSSPRLVGWLVDEIVGFRAVSIFGHVVSSLPF